MTIIKGELFKCSKHGIDYRICCEECLENHERFNDFLKKTVLFKEIKDDLIRDEVSDTKEDYFKGSKEDIGEVEQNG